MAQTTQQQQPKYTHPSLKSNDCRTGGNYHEVGWWEGKDDGKPAPTQTVNCVGCGIPLKLVDGSWTPA